MGFIASALGAFDTSTPKPRDVGSEYERLVAAYLNPATMSGIYGAEAQYKPKYTDLALSNFGRTLNGSNGQPGLMDFFAGANRASRGADVADLSAFGGDAATAWRGLNPQGTSLMDKLYTQAERGLALGDKVDPNTTSRISNSVGTDWANRGLGRSNQAELDAAMRIQGTGQDLFQARQNWATGIEALGQNQNQSVMNLLTRNSDAVGAAGAFQGASAMPSLFPTTDQYDIFNTAYNARAASNLNNANNAAAGANTY